MSCAGIFRLVRAVVAFLFVFQPTNVQPLFVAVGVKSTAPSYATVALVFVAEVPPLVA